jgi:hypothetical protein
VAAAEEAAAPVAAEEEEAEEEPCAATFAVTPTAPAAASAVSVKAVHWGERLAEIMNDAPSTEAAATVTVEKVARAGGGCCVLS